MPRSRFTVRLLSPAEQDLEEIILYVAAERPAAATRLLARIDAGLRRRATHPHAGKIPLDDVLSRLRYRHLTIAPYLVCYTIEGRTVLIHRIVHGARDLTDLS